MTEDEYREFLTALARKHLRPIFRLGPEGAVDHLKYDIKRLSSVARFVKVVSERPDNSALVKACSDELRNTYVGHIADAMQRAGVLAALDEAADITFPNLRRSVIPDEGLLFLRHAGVEDPDADIRVACNSFLSKDFAQVLPLTP